MIGFVSMLILLFSCGGGGGGTSSTKVTILMGGAIQGTSLSLTGDLTTIAGTTGITGSADGIGTAAQFSGPMGITTDGKSVYVADGNNNTIRKIVISTRKVTTLAGTAGTTGSDDGGGPNARFLDPYGITTDGQNLYLVDSGNFTIRKIVISTGDVTTLAGKAGIYGSADGIGAAASFECPKGITTDGTNLFVTDCVGTIRKIVISTGEVSTLAGTAHNLGSTDGIGTAASFNNPSGITTDGINLYVVDGLGIKTIRKIIVSNREVTTVSTIADTFIEGLFGITTDATALYIADHYNHTIRKLIS